MRGVPEPIGSAQRRWRRHPACSSTSPAASPDEWDLSSAKRTVGAEQRLTLGRARHRSGRFDPGPLRRQSGRRVLKPDCRSRPKPPRLARRAPCGRRSHHRDPRNRRLVNGAEAGRTLSREQTQPSPAQRRPKPFPPPRPIHMWLVGRTQEPATDRRRMDRVWILRCRPLFPSALRIRFFMTAPRR